MPTIKKHDKKAKNWKTKKGRAGAVLINRWENFYKILMMDLLELHDAKQKKFLKHFAYNKTTRWLLDFSDLTKNQYTAKQLKEIFALNSNPKDRLKKMYSLGFIKIIRTNNNYYNSKQTYILTKKYHKFINKLRPTAPLLYS